VAGLVTKLREMGTDVTDEALADVATVSAGNNRVVRRAFLRPACKSFTGIQRTRGTCWGSVLRKVNLKVHCYSCHFCRSHRHQQPGAGKT
jgi:hypothetical protein